MTFPRSGCRVGRIGTCDNCSGIAIASCRFGRESEPVARQEEVVSGGPGRQQLESLPLAPGASRRRHDLLDVLDRINPTIAELTHAIEQKVKKCPETQRLMTHPGVSALTALAFVLILGERSGSTAASRLPAISVWCRRKIPPESVVDWDTSVNRATSYCVSCSWKRRRPRCAAMCDGAAGSFTWTWPSDEVETLPKLPWRGDWQFVCTVWDAEDGITPNWKASVRTRDSLDILMVCGPSPT